MLKLILRFALLLGIYLTATSHVGAGDEKKIKEAVDKAIQYLNSHYSAVSSAPIAVVPTAPGTIDDGPIALSGIALLEAKMPLDDPAILDIARITRSSAIDQKRTYHLALELIFLDKLGQESDILLIQSIAARLILGQTSAGGWTYVCPELEASLKQRLKNDSIRPAAKGSDTPEIGTDVNRRPQIDPDIEQMLKRSPAGSQPNRRESDGDSRPDDNSNTQFALIALWSARRHGMPVENSLRAVEKRFRESQYKGGWGYVQPPGYSPTASMTCAGLLGLAVSSGMQSERVMKAHNPPGADEKKKKEPHSESPRSIRNPLKDPAVQAGLAFLANEIRTNQIADPRAGATPPGSGARGVPALPRSDDLRDNLYFLWSFERVCVVFGLTRLGNLDWYQWGANRLLARQKADGSWISLNGSSRNGVVPDTAFALMFLVHANIVRDLTHALKATAPPEDGNVRPSSESRNKETNDERKPLSALAESLLNASPDKQADLIQEYSTKRGNEYSLALAEAIPKLKPPIQEKARSTLAVRMARFKAPVIREWLKYDDAEIRRAAAVGTSVHEEAKSFIPDLIKALDDPDEIVWRGAGLALRTITKKDLGPRKGDTDAERQKAKGEWEAWWKTQQ